MAKVMLGSLFCALYFKTKKKVKKECIVSRSSFCALYSKTKKLVKKDCVDLLLPSLKIVKKECVDSLKIVKEDCVDSFLILCALYSETKKIIKKNCADLREFDDPGDASAEPNTVDGARIEEPGRAEELHIQKAYYASELDSKIEISASSSSTIPPSPTFETKSVKAISEVGKPSESFCEICMEHRETWQMFINSTCSHSFCYECTSKYTETKVQDKVEIVTCPAVKCNATLDSGACRWMFSEDILIGWDESLCKSLIEESQKLYCPFRDCSIMLVNDSGANITEAKCPICQRKFCARCQVPWHSEFTCKEYVELSGKKEGGVDLMVKKIAKKKGWKNCPSCNTYVERTEGCAHITCRCSHEFCYKCGSKWSRGHAARCWR